MSPASANDLDGGWGWVIVACGFLIHFCTLGVTYAFGVVAAEFVESLDSSRQLNGWITSLMIGISVLAGPIASAACKKFGERPVCMAGGFVSAAGFAASFFVTRAWMLVVSAGCVTGFGMCMTITASLVSINNYFDRRLSTAMGIATCGAGVGGFVFGPLISFLIETFAWRGAMLLLSGALLQCGVFGSLLLPRSPSERAVELGQQHEHEPLQQAMEFQPPIEKPLARTRQRLIDLTLMRNAVFVVFCFSNVLSNTGYNAAFLYMPDRAQRAGFSRTESSLLVSVMGIANMAGRFGFGCLADVRGVSRLGLYNSTLCVAGLTLIFSFASDAYAFMIVYCATYGAFVGAFVPVTPLIIIDLLGPESLTDGLGLTLMFQGIGVVVGPPIAGFIFDSTASFDLTYVMCGGCVLAGGLLLLPVLCLRPRQSGATHNPPVLAAESVAGDEKQRLTDCSHPEPDCRSCDPHSAGDCERMRS